LNNNALGKHCILELHDCPFALINDETFVRDQLEQAARKALSTLLSMGSHTFSPQGLTAFALLAESHISIHTWPELGYAAVDIFTCGDTAKPELACEFLAGKFRAGRHDLRVLTRGMSHEEASAGSGASPKGRGQNSTDRVRTAAV
jgi:S-adenosylmethionine decarboxylase